MALSEEDKKRIEEEEEYRAKVRSEHPVKQEVHIHQKKGHGCLYAVLAFIFIPLILIGFLTTGTPSEDADIGKYAYNSTNGVYRGKILEKKDCASDSSFKCFVVENGGTKMEAPVDNVLVKDTPPSE